MYLILKLIFFWQLLFFLLMHSINMKLGLALLLIIATIVCVITQKAFLLSSSVGYYNYRQNANVLKVYHLLKQSGFQDNDIILAYS